MVNVSSSSAARFQLVIRMMDKVGTFANVLAVLKRHGINVEEVTNTVFEGGVAACAKLRLLSRPTEACLAEIRAFDEVLARRPGDAPDARVSRRRRGARPRGRVARSMLAALALAQRAARRPAPGARPTRARGRRRRARRRDAGAGRAAADAAPAGRRHPADVERRAHDPRAGTCSRPSRKDDADLATDILFPRDGWLATRDAADPGKEWEKRVDAPVPADPARAVAPAPRSSIAPSSSSLELGHAIDAGDAASGTAGRSRSGSCTARGSRSSSTGTRGRSPIREMIAWRGAWYVTRLR